MSSLKLKHLTSVNRGLAVSVSQAETSALSLNLERTFKKKKRGVG